MFDDMLELFKGQITLEQLKVIPMKEMLMLRDARVERLKKEQERLEGANNNNVQQTGQNAEQIRNNIARDLNYFGGRAEEKIKKR